MLTHQVQSVSSIAQSGSSKGSKGTTQAVASHDELVIRVCALSRVNLTLNIVGNDFP